MTTSRYDAALGTELERTNALEAVVWAWRAMVGMPLVAFAVIQGTLSPATSGQLTGLGLLFLVLSLLVLVLVLPPAILLRAHCFRAAWRGQPVDPVSYTRGLLTVWLVMVGAAVLSLASCVASETLLPGILPGALAMILLALTGPSAKALALPE